MISSNDDSDNFKRFNIEYRGRRTGYVNYHFEGDDLIFVDDLRLEEDKKPCACHVVFYPFDLLGLALFPPERFRVTNYQKRGLGTAMIKFFGELCKVGISEAGLRAK